MAVTTEQEKALNDFEKAFKKLEGKEGVQEFCELIRTHTSTLGYRKMMRIAVRGKSAKEMMEN